jgi:hypothetical protein
MDIEHCDCLSWFSDGSESHEQDGEKLSRAAAPLPGKAPGDPAMALEPPLRRTGAVAPGSNIGGAFAAGETTDSLRKASGTSRAATPRGIAQRRMPSFSINTL